ncbi:unnamed protein product [Ectocarpus sp. CCAP 1310/34]|nr:unnamed protein product [Ectocarpus sp. CCAP 1310/34]
MTGKRTRAKMEELENSPMNPGENPDDNFNQKHLLRAQLDKIGEPISGRRFKDICVQGFSDEDKDVKLMVFRDPTFNVLDMQSTMRNIFLDEQSHKGWKGRIAGRGFAMATTASDIICHSCYEPGHIRRNCPKIKNRAKKKTKPAGATKWCFKHNTTSHSDEECYQQEGKRPEDTKDSRKHLLRAPTALTARRRPTRTTQTMKWQLSTSPGTRTPSTAASCSPRVPASQNATSPRAPPGWDCW